jgi:hypothetical protein
VEERVALSRNSSKPESPVLAEGLNRYRGIGASVLRCRATKATVKTLVFTPVILMGIGLCLRKLIEK